MQDKFIRPCRGAPRAGISQARSHPSPQQVIRADLEMLLGPIKSLGKFTLIRQVQDQSMTSIQRSESRSAGTMARRGHGCEGSEHRRTYSTLLAGTGKDDMGLLGLWARCVGGGPQ